MNVLSLFDGISCGQIALDRAGIKVDNYFASEIDKHAIKVTQHNYPSTIQIGDVTKIDCSSLPKIDLLLGGSPCTNFSFAGNRKGMVTKDNEEITDLARYLELKAEGFEFQGQSYLFWEYVKILNEVKPTYFLLENVKMAKKWQKVISDTLGCESILINSALVSAQNRNRLYWTNIPNVTQPTDKSIVLNDILSLNEISYRYWGTNLIHKLNNNLYARKDYYIFENINGKVRSLLSNNSTINKQKIKYDDKVRLLTPLEWERLQTIPDLYTQLLSNTARYRVLGNSWTVDVIVHILQGLKINQAEKEII